MGKVIAIVGVDGSGKSTLINKLNYESRHFYSALAKNSGQKISKALYSQSIIRSSRARWFLGYIFKVLIPNLIFILKIKYFSKRLVIFDRFVFDTIVSLKSTPKMSFLEKTMLYILYWFPRPSFVVFLSIDTRLAFKRTGEFSDELLEQKQIALRSLLSSEANTFEFDVTHGSEAALKCILDLGEEENFT